MHDDSRNDMVNQHVYNDVCDLHHVNEDGMERRMRVLSVMRRGM